ncbi:MAG: cytochrome c oxidase subunit II [Acidobacteriota bacterium]
MRWLLGHWLPIDASAHGAEIDRLIFMIHWLMAVLLVGWCLYFLVVLFRFRVGRHPNATYAGVETHFSSYIEVSVAVVEAVLLIAFAIPTWSRWVTRTMVTDNVVQVRVVAEQFNWNVHYPGPDGVFGRADVSLVDAVENPLGLDRTDPNARDDVTTINQLHLPVNRYAEILLTSKDVVHSFFLPVMRVKQDAIPGMVVPVHFEPIEITPEAARYPGCEANKNCWEIACAQLCGLSHYRMRGFLTVESQEDFDAWLAAQTAGATDAPAPVVGGDVLALNH